MVLKEIMEKIRRVLEATMGHHTRTGRVYDGYISEPELRSLFDLDGIADDPQGFTHDELILQLKARSLIYGWVGNKRFFKLTRAGRKWVRDTDAADFSKAKCHREPQWT